MEKHKPIVSFVRRERRSTQRFPEELWKIYGISTLPPSNSLIQHFTHVQPLTIEIGFGDGDSLFAQAQSDSTQNYIGVEVYRTGIKKLLYKIHDASLKNIKLLEGDAVDLLKRIAPAPSIQNIQILFPDPWHKSRHHKRRLIQKDFIELLYNLLETNGKLYLATDSAHYAQQMLYVLTQSRFTNTCINQGFSERPSHIPETKFEKRAKTLKHPLFYLVFTK